MGEAGQASWPPLPRIQFSNPLPCIPPPAPSTHTPQLGFPISFPEIHLEEGIQSGVPGAFGVILHRDTGNLQEIKKEDKDIYYIGKYVQSKSSWYFKPHSSLWL